MNRTTFNSYYNISDTETTTMAETASQGTPVWAYAVIAVGVIAAAGIVIGVIKKKGGKGKHSA